MKCVLVLLGGVIALLLGPAPPAAAQDVAVMASVDATTIGSRETLTYTLTVEGVPLARIETPQPPAATGLVLQQATPVTRTTLSYANGTLKRAVIFRWRYRPVGPGTARLDPVRVSVDGRAYGTAPIDVRVVSRARPSSNAAPHNRSAPRPRRTGTDESSFDRADLFIRAEADAQRAYVGEQVPITYRLYFRTGLQLHSSRLAGAWHAAGFWREELDVPARPLPRTVRIDGTRYRTFVLKQVAVFPTRAGTLRVSPLRIETQVRDTRSLLGRFLPAPGERVKIASDPVVIEVRPLPAGAPPTFGGAVGSYRMDVRLAGTNAAVGKAVELRVQLSGTGNLALLEPPTVNAPDSFVTYDPEVHMDIDRSGTRVRGTKTFTYTLVPQARGTFSLPPVTFAYFDPRAGQYEVLRAAPRPLHVEAGRPSLPAAGVTSEGFPVGDLAGPIGTAASWIRPAAPPLHARPWVWALLVAPALLVAGLLTYRRLYDRRAADPRHARRRRLKAAHEQLKAARAAAPASRSRRFYAAVERVLLDFVGDALGRAARGLTHQELDAHLARAGVEEALRSELRAFLTSCDHARFAPAMSVTPPDAAYEQARMLLDALDAALHEEQSART